MTQKSEEQRQSVRQPHRISAAEAGQRVDNFLLNRLKGVPRSHVYRLLRSGQVRVNSGRVQPTYRLLAGDLVRLPPVRMNESAPVRVPDEFVQLIERSIQYEDQGLVVLNKPAGVSVHAGSGVLFGVIEALRQARPDLPGLALAHRLDRDTSGLLLLAKSRQTLVELHAAFRDRNVDKEYLALVAGAWPKSIREKRSALTRDRERGGERRVVADPDGKWSVSRFVIRERYGDLATLLAVKIETGRTHQIRVHTADVGYPIAGDDKYGERGVNRGFRQYGLKRMFLHAAELKLPLASGDRHFSAALPDELARVLGALPR